jgi:hypothetical protein
MVGSFEKFPRTPGSTVILCVFTRNFVDARLVTGRGRRGDKGSGSVVREDPKR